MALLHSNDPVSNLAENIVLLDLGQMSDSEAILSRVRNDVAGVYSWYRKFEFDKDIIDDADKFIEFVVRELDKKHCVEREARLAPAHKILLSADNRFTKIEALKTYAQNPQFRSLVLNLLK